MADNTIKTNNWTSNISPEAANAKKKTTGMDMQGFLKVMAAQMENQSMTSQTDDSQYITEMTLFSAIQAMNTQTTESNKQYAASLVGSNVLLNDTQTVDGKQKQISGIVSKAVFNETTGESFIQIGDKTYSLSSVAEDLGPDTSQAAMSYLLTARQYAISLMGKDVVIDTTDKNGSEEQVAGKVKNVSFDPKTDAASVTLDNGETYSAGLVSKINP